MLTLTLIGIAVVVFRSFGTVSSFERSQDIHRRRILATYPAA